MSEHISSLSEFLLHAGTEYRVFDMGRCIRDLEPQVFLEIENAQRVAPFPRQQHAWFGIVYWNKQLSHQQYIWFLKLPLDEQGKVVDAARQHFLELVMTALAEQTQDADKLEKASQTQQNPYVFTPNQQQLADFNARSKIACGAAAGNDYQIARQYMESPQVVDWQQISLQGLADCVHFATQGELLGWLEQLPTAFPQTVQQHLLCALEDRTVSASVAEAVINLIKVEQIDSQPCLWALRAIAQIDDETIRNRLITQVVSAESLSADALTVVVGRHWQALNESNMLKLLEHAAKIEESGNSGFFASLFADVAQLPETRAAALSVLRSPDRSQTLSVAIGTLFQQN